MLKCEVKEHLLYHLKGAQGLEHVADDEEDVGDAEAGEEPVEGGRHRPDDHRNHDEVHHHGILHEYLAKLGTGNKLFLIILLYILILGTLAAFFCPCSDRRKS